MNTQVVLGCQQEKMKRIAELETPNKAAQDAFTENLKCLEMAKQLQETSAKKRESQLRVGQTLHGPWQATMLVMYAALTVPIEMIMKALTIQRWHILEGGIFSVSPISRDPCAASERSSHVLQSDLQAAEAKVRELKEDLEHVEQVASEKQMVVDAQVRPLAGMH